jgi:hypothetical protein
MMISMPPRLPTKVTSAGTPTIDFRWQVVGGDEGKSAKKRGKRYHICLLIPNLQFLML